MMISRVSLVSEICAVGVSRALIVRCEDGGDGGKESGSEVGGELTLKKAPDYGFEAQLFLSNLGLMFPDLDSPISIAWPLPPPARPRERGLNAAWAGGCCFSVVVKGLSDSPLHALHCCR